MAKIFESDKRISTLIDINKGALLSTGLLTVSPSDMVQINHAEVKLTSSSSGTVVREIKCFFKGRIKIKYELRRVTANASSQVSVNGTVAFSHTGVSSTEFVEREGEADVNIGDVVKLTQWGSTSGKVESRNFRLCFSINDEYDLAEILL